MIGLYASGAVPSSVPMGSRAGAVRTISQAVLAVVLTTVAGVSIHTAVMLLDYFLVKRPLVLNFEQDFFGTAFSSAMIPVMVGYVLFALLLLAVWRRLRRTMLAAIAQDLVAAEQRSALETMQILTGEFAQHISARNVEILNWAAQKRGRGETVPARVEDSARAISVALGEMTKLAFLSPYSGEMPRAPLEVRALIRSRLAQRPSAHESAPTRTD